MAIRHYIFCESKIVESEVIREITWDEYRAVKDVLGKVGGKDLSFYDTFGQKDSRITIPFKSSAKTEIQELINFFEKNGYDVDFEEGVVSSEKEIPAGPNKGKLVKKKVKIGKILQQILDITKKYNVAIQEYGSIRREHGKTLEKGDPKIVKQIYAASDKALKYWDQIKKIAQSMAIGDPWQNKGYWSVPKDGWGEKGAPIDPWVFDIVRNSNVVKFIEFWNKKSEYYRKNPKAVFDDSPKHTIIISRNPVDVLRMSDFQGITSCHSPSSRGGGGSYYQCAVAEAQGHGLVAYLVENSELPEDFDPQKGEIFADARRDIAGISPISRVRLRKFVHKDSETEIAVPEQRVYGEKIPGFLEAVIK